MYEVDIYKSKSFFPALFVFCFVFSCIVLVPAIYSVFRNIPLDSVSIGFIFQKLSLYFIFLISAFGLLIYTSGTRLVILLRDGELKITQKLFLWTVSEYSAIIGPGSYFELRRRFGFEELIFIYDNETKCRKFFWGGHFERDVLSSLNSKI